MLPEVSMISRMFGRAAAVSFGSLTKISVSSARNAPELIRVSAAAVAARKNLGARIIRLLRLNSVPSRARARPSDAGAATFLSHEIEVLDVHCSRSTLGAAGAFHF